MKKLVKIVVSPFSPSIEIAENIVIKVHVPYSEKDVTVLVNPNVQDYAENQDNPNIKVRQVMAASKTDESRTFRLDFQDNNVQTFEIRGGKYNIKLMSIGKEKIQGQKFPYFEFFVEKE